MTAGRKPSSGCCCTRVSDCALKILARDYFEQLDALVKGFFVFENSAHSPLLEEPLLGRRILKGAILNGWTNLADQHDSATTG